MGYSAWLRGGAIVLALLAGRAEAEDASRLALGLNVIGGQLAYNATDSLRAELRFQTTKSGAGADRVSANVAGARAYRLFWAGSDTHPYLGMEAARLMTKDRSGGRSASGYAGGGFIGFERKIASRLWVGADVGPYLVSLRDKGSGNKSTSLEFVVNTCMMVYLY